MDLSLLDEVLEYSDIIQVGSRNMSNFYMLAELGKVKKPVMLKRGMIAKTNEWLLAADYILSNGNEDVILCERGIRSFDPQMRNVFDVNVIPLIQSLSHLPIIADPSHGTGEAKFVYPISLAAVAAGANGLMIEIHPNPKTALSDSNQALTFDEFDTLLSRIQTIRESVVSLTL
jgi:3-deoxy-7-phosphoheptulonate synthase